MEKIVNLYDLEFISVKHQKKMFIDIIQYGVYNDGNKYIFDKNVFENDPEAKTLISLKPLVEKVEKLVEMINTDNSLINKDIETELWDML